MLMFSTRDTGERVVAGVMTGLMNLNDTVPGRLNTSGRSV